MSLRRQYPPSRCFRPGFFAGAFFPARHWQGVVAAVGFLSVSAVAQEGAKGGEAPTVSVPGVAGVPATAQGRVASGERSVAQVEDSAQRIRTQLTAAREERDVVRVLCLNDKVSQVEIALRSADDRLSALRRAGEAEAERSRHDYTVLQVVAERVQDLAREADQCVGEESGLDVDANVTVRVDPDLPDPSVADSASNTFLAATPRVASGIE